MLQAVQTAPPLVQALLAGTFTWLVTALGAATVYFTHQVHRGFVDAMLGFAAGVMLAASFWSLLTPSIDMAQQLEVVSWLPAAVGVLSGAAVLAAIDRIVPHLHFRAPRDDAEGVSTTWNRSLLLVLAITLHNIPEGLALGVAFGAVAMEAPGATMGAAVALTIGIALQNFPEGVVVAMPLRAEGMRRLRAFWYGQLSALVEPIAAVVGVTFVLAAQPALPYALGFAAGAMIFVVIEEVIPSAYKNGNEDLVTLSAIGGFVAMMILDVALG